ncbi:MAG: sulfite exporter TauE/SafE family protein [Novosphingobium sp.]
MTIHLILFAGAFLAAAISGAAGFGGALLLLPLLTRAVGPEAAVPLLTLGQLVGNLARVAFNWREVRWPPVSLFLLGAIPGAVAGALFFVELPRELITRLIGAGILLFVVLRLAGRGQGSIAPAWLVAGGSLTGFLSGLIGSAGPIGASLFLSLNLPPVAYIASEAMTALVMHGVKFAVYGARLALGAEFWPLAGLISAAMIGGTWASRWIVGRLPAACFRQFVAVLLIVVAMQMLIFG